MTDTETEPKFNADLAGKLLGWLAEHPAEHDQSSWARRTRATADDEWRTTMCAGAAACVLAGAELLWGDGMYTAYAGGVATESLPEHARSSSTDPDGTYLKETSVGRAAAKLLGIDDPTATRLFFDADDLPQIRAILEPLIAASDNN